MAGAVVGPIAIGLPSVSAAETPAAPSAAAPVRPPSLDELLRSPEVLDTALSPDGTQIAILREQREGEKRVSYVVLTQVSALDAPPRKVILGDYDVEFVEWANDERLLIWLRFTKTDTGQPTGFWYYDTFIKLPVRRIMAVGLDGKGEVVLFNNMARTLKRDFDLATVADFLVNDPRAILMQIWDYTNDCWALHRVDVYTGAATILERGGQMTDFWFMQDGVPVLRYDSNSRATVSIYARPPGEKDWKFIRKFRRNEVKKIVELDVVAATTEPGVLLISHQAEGEQFKTIRKFDLRTLQIGEVVVSKAGRELDSVFTDERKGLVAAAYLDERQAYEFVDPTLAAHFRGLNRFFNDECNVRLFDVNTTHNRFIVKVTGPRDPGSFHFYNKEARSLSALAIQSPWLKEERLAKVETLKLKARDGIGLTAYLTVPLAAGPRPLVVMPHGGPELRDSVDFDLWAQYLAAQGWLVLQPNFRGSGGYGKAFAQAGWRRWGDLMQDDLEDCVAQVMATGRVDRDRVAIMGASYGGYAALMGAVRRPELYRAAVSIAGDSDLMLALSYSRRTDGGDSPSYAYWVKNIGDPKTDADMLRAGSPVLQAARIQAPVLLIHGTEDDIVTVEASRDMAKALKRAGKVHEYMELKGEGHRGWDTEVHKKVLAKSGSFIAAAFSAAPARPST